MNQITVSQILSAVCYLAVFVATLASPLGLPASVWEILPAGATVFIVFILPIAIPLLIQTFATDDIAQANAQEALKLYINVWVYGVLLAGLSTPLLGILPGGNAILALADRLILWDTLLSKMVVLILLTLRLLLLIVSVIAITHCLSHPERPYRLPLPLTPVHLFTMILTFAFMYIPILVLAVYSFNDSHYSTGWKGFTWKWYVAFLNDTRILTALQNSLVVAVCAVAIAAVVGTLMAVGLARYQFPGKSIYRGIAYLPLIIPDIAIAVSTLVFLAAIAIPLSAGLIQLSLGTIIAAHVVFCLSYVAIVVSARLTNLNPHLEEAALDLGATPVQAFMQVMLPELMPAIVSGCLLAFVLSLDDFLIASFTAGGGANTLPMEIFSRIRTGVKPDINALSVVLILSTGFLFAMAEYLRYRSEQKRFGTP